MNNVKWRDIECWGNIEYPAFFAKEDTQQVHFWPSHSAMVSNEPLFVLYTHWAPAGEAMPAPPPKRDPVREGFEVWYNEVFRASGYPSQLAIWRAGVAFGSKTK
jgi:hypothetical protein